MPDENGTQVKIARLEGKVGRLENDVVDLKECTSSIKQDVAATLSGQESSRVRLEHLSSKVDQSSADFREFRNDIKSFVLKVAASVIAAVVIAVVLQEIRL